MKLSTECLEASQVDSLLLGNLTPEEYEAAQNHLELCEPCRTRVEATIGPEQWWSDVQSVLLNSRAGAFSQRNASSTDAEPNERSTAKLLDLLGPTDDPNMLGRIGPYEIIGLLGQGGMGAVFKGFDRSLNRFVAIKMLLPHLAASGAARKRFAREGQAVAAVVDDHVMAIHSVDEWQGVPYLVMTYSRGISLQKRLSDNGPLEVREILRIGMQAAKGLAAAHAQGIVHRDIKPANIFLDQNVERVQLMDFGLARAVDDASLTRSGTLAGTPQYMSPEQARAETVDHRSDLFSLGSVMYAMCTGHAPFRAESSYSVLRLITDKEPRSIRELNPEIPVWLCAITSKLMAKKASDRFASAQEVAKLLEDCLAHIQQPATTPLPTSLVPNAAIVHRPVFKVTRKGVMTMLGFIGMTLLGTMVWQSTDPPDISGQWASDEWGTVVLEAKEPGHYEGTFRGMSRAADPKVLSIKDFNAGEVKVDFNVVYPDLTRVLDKPNTGTLRINWSRVERRFNGTWKFDIEQTKSSVTPEGAILSTKVTDSASDGRDGNISLRLVDDEIRGAWTTNKVTQKETGGPRLADLMWKRSVVAVPDGVYGEQKLDEYSESTQQHSSKKIPRTINLHVLDADIQGSSLQPGEYVDVYQTRRNYDHELWREFLFFKKVRVLSMTPFVDKSKDKGSGRSFELSVPTDSNVNDVDLAEMLPLYEKALQQGKVRWIVRPVGLNAFLVTSVDTPNTKRLQIREATVADTSAESSEQSIETNVVEFNGMQLRLNPAQPAILTEDDIMTVESVTDPNNLQASQIVLTLTPEAGERFLIETTRLSSQPNPGYLVIEFDGTILSAPRVNDKISSKVAISFAERDKLNLEKVVSGIHESIADREKVGEKEPDARSVVEAYVAAVLAGDVAKAAALAKNSPADPKRIRELPEFLNVQRLEIETVYVNDPAKPTRALATSVAVKLDEEHKNPDGRRDGFMVFSLELTDDKWLVIDIDFETESGAEKELKKFIQANPNSIGLPPQSQSLYP